MRLLIVWRNGLVVWPVLARVVGTLRVVGASLPRIIRAAVIRSGIIGTTIVRSDVIGPTMIGLVHLWRILTVLLLLVGWRNRTTCRLRRLLAIVWICSRLISRALLDSALIAGYNGGWIRSRRAERLIGLARLIRLIRPVVGALIAIALRSRELILRTATIGGLTRRCCDDGASR